MAVLAATSAMAPWIFPSPCPLPHCGSWPLPSPLRSRIFEGGGGGKKAERHRGLWSVAEKISRLKIAKKDKAMGPEPNFYPFLAFFSFLAIFGNFGRCIGTFFDVDFRHRVGFSRGTP